MITYHAPSQKLHDALVLSPPLMKAQDLKKASVRDLKCMAIFGATWYHRGRDPSSVWRYGLGCSTTFRAIARVLGVGPEWHIREASEMNSMPR